MRVNIGKHEKLEGTYVSFIGFFIYINISNLENGRTQDAVGVGGVDGDVDGWNVARLEHPLVMAVLSVEHPEQTRVHHNNVNFTR